MNSTLTYYNQNAKEFVSNTRNVDFNTVRTTFTELLPEGANILDFGCGSGRDTKAFLEKHYKVDAIDGSLELCKLASQYTGIEVKCMLFEELCQIEVYDGIWASASLLHLPYSELKNVFIRISKALKIKGFLYTSFKYGEFEGERNGRYFTDMTEEKYYRLLNEVGGVSLIKSWITTDVRQERVDEKWLNVILQKK